MDELKTLKDFEAPSCEDVCPDKCKGYETLKEELRQEAINDIKELYRIKNYTLEEAQKKSNTTGCCTNYPLCSMGQGFLTCGGDKEQIEPIIRYIMWKNNLTEWDLQ